MEQQHPKEDWEKLRGQLLHQLTTLNYKESTLTNYRRALNRIGIYLSKHDIQNYSVAVGMQYLNEWRAKIKPTPDSIRFTFAVIRRLNDLISGKEYVFHHRKSGKICPDIFSSQFDDFLTSLRKKGNRESTIELNRLYCIQFLHLLEEDGILDLKEIKPEHIYNAFSKSTSKTNFRTTVSQFLRYLYRQQILNTDLAAFVPKYRTPHLTPSTYSVEELQLLLGAVNRDTSIGKRDYAILMIAIQLGLRVSDICKLTASNIDTRNKMIDLTQQKTNIPLHTPLLPDVEDAIDEYVSRGRPKSDCPIIFLSSKAPYTALLSKSIRNITNKYFKLAHINTEGKKRGGHSLRMSLATQLVSENVPYGVVQKILGQEDPNSTKHYVAIDVDKLRSCALEVSPLPAKLVIHLSRQGMR